MHSSAPQSHPSLLVPSIALGLSCGAGYVIAREGFKRVNWERTFRLLSRQLVNPTVPWWLLFLGHQAVLPITAWWIWKQIGEEGTDIDEGLKEPDLMKDSTPGLQKETQHVAASDIKVSETFSLLDTIKMKNPAELSRSSPELKGSVRNLDLSVLEQLVSLPEMTKKSEPQRYLEMLVHNVSHKDLVISLDTGDDGEYCLCRPRFSAFDLFSRRILASLSETNPEIVSFRRYERSDATPRYSIVTPRPSRQTLIPTGIKLASGNPALHVSCSELSNLRVRGRDAPRIEQYCGESPKESNLCLDHAFFPLLATLLPRWYQQMTQKYGASASDVKKVLILVSGVGTPRNWTHSITGNSTEAFAQLME